ncbi:MAG TPA: exodeoxyribonuclease V subunit alpha [Pseudomonadales bacterium]|nr:exodeoxyribonuclease V subunit alpha [Pseudomonadales bacterium]
MSAPTEQGREAHPVAEEERADGVRDELLRPIDLHFGEALARWARPPPDAAGAALLARLGARLSAELGRQNACLTLGELDSPDWPDVAELRALLDASGVLQTPDRPAPLVLRDDRLYLARFDAYEGGVADALTRRGALRVRASAEDDASVARRLRELFPDEGDIDWQRVAAAIALERALAVITGGPGTGKTTTVTRLLVMLLEQAGSRPLRIRLAAPTGKAAARLTESIRESRQRLLDAGLCSEEIAARLPESAETLHRLLGFRALENGFRYGADLPLAADVVVVDEASMVDLRMMAQLLAALGDDTRLILLGDKDQLSSVEAGRVLGDLCAWTDTHFERQRWSVDAARKLQALTGYDFAALADAAVPPLADCLCLLLRSHRFDAASAIGRFAVAVNDGRPGPAVEALAAGHEDLVWDADGGTRAVLEGALDEYRDALRLALEPDVDPLAALAAYGRFQLLCATRGGPFGVARLNAALEAGFRGEGLIPPGDVMYPGRPVMVTVNDYAAGLFNGDTGLLLRGADGALRAWFLGPDRALRSVRPTRLPHHETVFAMTVHKSQGSEFDRVAVVLPAEPGANEDRLLTREMLYTAVTRARSGVRVHATQAVLERAIGRRTRRASGLRGRLWGDDDGTS